MNESSWCLGSVFGGFLCCCQLSSLVTESSFQYAASNYIYFFSSKIGIKISTYSAGLNIHPKGTTWIPLWTWDVGKTEVPNPAQGPSHQGARNLVVATRLEHPKSQEGSLQGVDAPGAEPWRVMLSNLDIRKRSLLRKSEVASETYLVVKGMWVRSNQLRQTWMWLFWQQSYPLPTPTQEWTSPPRTWPEDWGPVNSSAASRR